MSNNKQMKRMRGELMSDEQMVERIIELSCDYDMSVGAPSFAEQREFFQSLKSNPRMVESAKAFLNGDIQEMPRVVGLHVW